VCLAKDALFAVTGETTFLLITPSLADPSFYLPSNTTKCLLQQVLLYKQQKRPTKLQLQIAKISIKGGHAERLPWPSESQCWLRQPRYENP
jgi:hypothetical protein